jgi:hypothetical protein
MAIMFKTRVATAQPYCDGVQVADWFAAGGRGGST